MDGTKGGVTSSLQFRLSLWLSLAVIALAAAAGCLSFFSAFDEAIELQDDQLRQIAALIQHQHLDAPSAAFKVPHADPESRVIVLHSQASGAWTPRDEAFGLRSDLPDGLQTITIGSARWRLFVSTNEDKSRTAVGQQTAVRDEIASKSAVGTIAPLLVLVLIQPVLVGYAIRKTLAPLKKMAADLEFRSERDWQRIGDDRVPSEIRPFVGSIKHLLSRIAQSVALQRRFLADAAHELRSPLTALSLQAERLEAAEMSEQAQTRLATLRRGIKRTRGLLDQLLALARAQGETYNAQPVSLNRVFRQVLEHLMPLIDSKRIDIGVVSQYDIMVEASEIDLTVLVKNLLDNAVRYTPNDGRIDLAIQMGPNGAMLRIDDTGPGIPVTERERVFDPFYRLLGDADSGSGLGLSIVRTIADRMGASVSLGQSDQGGLRVTVTFPHNLFTTAANVAQLPRVPDRHNELAKSACIEHSTKRP
jgi:two-component system, OmpR family, sensor kinase